MSDYAPYCQQRIADRMAIQDLIYQWCRAVDRLDLEAIRQVFHPDAIDNHGSYVGGVDGLVKWISERHRTIPCSVHKVGQILIEFGHGSDLAVVETYVETLQHYPPNAKASLAQLTGGTTGPDDMALDLMGRSRYVDRFERREGQWRIARRTLVFDWRGLVEVPANRSLQPQNGTLGMRNAKDLIYVEREKAGVSPPRK